MICIHKAYKATGSRESTLYRAVATSSVLRDIELCTYAK